MADDFDAPLDDFKEEQFNMNHDTISDDYNPSLDQLLRRAIKAKPEFELREMLSLHKSESLKELARTYKMKKYASSKKSEMIDFLCSALADHSFVESILLHTDDEEYAFFENVAVAGKVEMSTSKAAGMPYHFFRHLYYLEIYHISGKITFVVPDIIRDIFISLTGTSFPLNRKRYSMINSFATAFTSLYGVVDFEYFIELCNDQLEVNMDYDELANILTDFSWIRQSHYTVFGPSLIHSKFDDYTVHTEIDEFMVEESNDEVDRIESLQGSIPMKQLPLDEILKHSDPHYFEHTAAHERLAHFIEEYDPEVATFPTLLQVVLGKLNEEFMQNDDGDATLLGIDMRKHKSDNEVMKTYNDLIRDVERHTRKWSKNGWTLAEIEELL